MTLSSFSSENDPLPAPVPAGNGEDDALSPGLEQAITEWRRDLPKVRLADRVVAAWLEQASDAPASLVASDRTAEIRTTGACGAGDSTRNLRRGWRWIAAAAVLVVAGWSVWSRPGATVLRDGDDVAVATPADETSEATVSGAGLNRDLADGTGLPHGEGESVAEAATPVGEFVGDARAAVKELTAEATSAVTDLFAVAWAEPELKRRGEDRARRPEAVVGTDPAVGTSADAIGWGWSVTPLGEWSGGLQPVGKAVDYLYERLGDQPVDGDRSTGDQTSDAPLRPAFPVIGRTL